MQVPTPGGHSWPARLAYIAAGLFTLASAGTNLIYGWGKGADLGSSLVWAAVSVAVSIVFALSWPALIRSLDAKEWTRAVMVAVALLITGAYSVSAALGSAMGGRTNAANEERAIVEMHQKAQTAYDTAKTELDALAAAKPATDLQALVDNAKAELTRLLTARPHGHQWLLAHVVPAPRC